MSLHAYVSSFQYSYSILQLQNNLLTCLQVSLHHIYKLYAIATLSEKFSIAQSLCMCVCEIVRLCAHGIGVNVSTEKTKLSLHFCLPILQPGKLSVTGFGARIQTRQEYRREIIITLCFWGHTWSYQSRNTRVRYQSKGLDRDRTFWGLIQRQ